MSSHSEHQCQRAMYGFFAVVLALFGSMATAACGGNAAAPPPPSPPPVTSTPPPPPPAIAVSFATAPHDLDMGQTEFVTATANHDPNNTGVTWTVTCPTGVVTCGAMALATSASGTPDQFNAPANVNAAEVVTITASSKTDPTKSASVKITVNPTPTIVTPLSPSLATVGQPFSLDLSQHVGGGTAPFAWSIGVVPLPAGLTLSPSTGVLPGTPTGAPTTIVLGFIAADSGSPPVPVNLSLQLTINPQPALAASLTPSSFYFYCHFVWFSTRGACEVPTYDRGVATLTNLGSATLNISNITLTGLYSGQLGFSSACPASLATGQSCAIGVHWNAEGSPTGFAAGSVNVFDNAPDSPQSISLSGRYI